MFCTNCGARLPENARFCNQCGKPAAAPLREGSNNSRNAPLTSAPPLARAASSTGLCPDCGKPVTGCRIACPSCGIFLDNPVTYKILPGEYEHQAMQQMNRLLRGSAGLNSLANMISRKVGKPWYESSFNSILTTESQYPKVYELASIAARRIGLNRMPPVYVEADHVYQSATYGSLQDSFINIGTLVPRLLNDRELLFVLGHEFGHLLSEHALWTTVSMFLVGQHKSTVMSDGLLAYLSNPMKLLEQGFESLITNWMRVAEYTADRAALLVVGDFEIARRVLFLLYFKSRRELQEVNIEEWARSQESQDAPGQKISQIAGSPTPYLGSRLKELDSFYKSARYENLRARIETGCGINLDDIFDEKGSLRKGGKDPRQVGEPVKKEEISPAKPDMKKARVVKGACPGCGAGFTMPLEKLGGKAPASVRCNSCKKIFNLELGRVPGGSAKTGAERERSL